MYYISTRGEDKNKTFIDIITTGTASDGGLYMPKQIPSFTIDEMQEMQHQPYNEIAFTIISKFVDGDIDDNDLKEIINKTYSHPNFCHQAIAPLHQIDCNKWIANLYHGPTFAFKDFALQLMGNLIDYVLNKKQQKILSVGATSGDTGSAAIHGFKNVENLKLFVLHPYGLISNMQRKQMVTIDSPNIYNIALKGNFDDGQSIVKSILKNEYFEDSEYKLMAINSINWGRIMAQIVYYFFTAIKLGSFFSKKEVIFSVPTGNFGNVFAGYIAKKMGLPIKKLIIGTNNNDILHRFIQKNNYSLKTLKQTISPSMDIQVASNFERLLYEAYNQDSTEINNLMQNFKQNQNIVTTSKVYNYIKSLFHSYAIADEYIIKAIKQIIHKTATIVCPHTAIGIQSIYNYETETNDKNINYISLATAHPAKFIETYVNNDIDCPIIPEQLSKLDKLEEKYQILDNDEEIIKDYIRKNI